MLLKRFTAGLYNGMGNGITHTAPVDIKNEGRPVRAGKENPLYYIQWIDNLLHKIEPGRDWHHYFTNDFETVKARYLKARGVFTAILKKSEYEVQ